MQKSRPCQIYTCMYTDYTRVQIKIQYKQINTDFTTKSFLKNLSSHMQVTATIICSSEKQPLKRRWER